MNFQSGMSSEKFGKTDMAEKTCLCISFHRDSAGSTTASGTSDCEDTFLFRVYIDESASFTLGKIHSRGSEKSDFFAYSKDNFKWRVRNLFVIKESKRISYGNAVISAKSCAFGCEIFSVYQKAKSVFFKI